MSQHPSGVHPATGAAGAHTLRKKTTYSSLWSRPSRLSSVRSLSRCVSRARCAGAEPHRSAPQGAEGGDDAGVVARGLAAEEGAVAVQALVHLLPVLHVRRVVHAQLRHQRHPAAVGVQHGDAGPHLAGEGPRRRRGAAPGRGGLPLPVGHAQRGLERRGAAQRGRSAVPSHVAAKQGAGLAAVGAETRHSAHHRERTKRGSTARAARRLRRSPRPLGPFGARRRGRPVPGPSRTDEALRGFGNGTLQPRTPRPTRQVPSRLRARICTRSANTPARPLKGFMGRIHARRLPDKWRRGGARATGMRSTA